MIERFTFVMVGHVDHGKSSLIGRLLADTGTFPESKVEKVRSICEKNNKPFEYAFLLDALQEEHEQGITIDTTKIEFSTSKRDYTIIDAPGHKEFLKNMISGASRAEAAILIIDAKDGVQEQSTKHAYLLSLLGISQVIVLINKMDLVDYTKDRFEEVRGQILDYLSKLKISPKQVIPVSAMKGDCVTSLSEKMSWYTGPTVLDALDHFTKEKAAVEKSLRLPIQDCYKFDHRRIIAGKIESGTLKVGDTIMLSPSGHTTTVKTIEHWPVEQGTKTSAHADQSVGITVSDEYFFKRGEFISHTTDRPTVSDMLTAHIFWMGQQPLVQGKSYKLKINTQEVECTVHAINSVVDSSSLAQQREKVQLDRHDVGTVVLKTKQPVVFDPFSENSSTGRFVLVDDYQISGGGIIEHLPSSLKQRSTITTKSTDVSPRRGMVTDSERQQKLDQRGKVLWFTGLPGSGKTQIAQQLERDLFDQGKHVYYLDASNMRLSLSSDLDFSESARKENCRRIAEVANLLMNAGYIVIVNIVSPYKESRELARSIIGEDNYLEFFVDTPVEVCRKNNPRGIYDKADRGEASVPGVSFPYERSDYLIFTLGIDQVDFSVSDKVDILLKQLGKEL